MAEIRFDGKAAIVTGAGGGLGKTYAMELAKRGCKVVVNDLGGSTSGEGADKSAAQKVVDEIKKAGGVAVANTDSVEFGEKIVKTCLDNFGKVDIVIANAGILRDVSFSKMKDSDWDIIFKVHVNGTYSVVKAAWPHMMQQKYGRIIVTTSAAGIYGNFGQANYSAAKLALVGFMNTLAKEGKKSNVYCNAIAPVAGSRMTATVMPADMIENLKPEYVMPVVLYMCSEQSTENGATIETAAGWAAKLRWQRAKGAMIPLNKPLTIEAVRDNWEAVCAFGDDSEYPSAANDAFGNIMQNLQSKL
jgi:3-hydroxyacyl-CoA dehydrogenase/3a,7a,12a-trihydroxy-5b-cholest-24-enoyl-CoA hydratase